jgi:hypothetical protein
MSNLDSNQPFRNVFYAVLLISLGEKVKIK